MKFYKQLRINKNSAKTLEFTYSTQYEGQYIMDIPYELNPNDPFDVRPNTLPIIRAIRIPTGPTTERPQPDKWYSTNGLIRYNTDEDALEVLTNGVWIQLKAKQPADVTIQRFGADPNTTIIFDPDEETYQVYEGNEATQDDAAKTEITPGEIASWSTISYVDGEEVNFGPLIDVNEIEPKSAANIFVYVENVFQIPYTNYVMKEAGDLLGAKSYPDGKYIVFESPPPVGKTVTVIHGFD